MTRPIVLSTPRRATSIEIDRRFVRPEQRRSLKLNRIEPDRLAWLNYSGGTFPLRVCGDRKGHRLHVNVNQRHVWMTTAMRVLTLGWAGLGNARSALTRTPLCR